MSAECNLTEVYRHKDVILMMESILVNYYILKNSG